MSGREGGYSLSSCILARAPPFVVPSTVLVNIESGARVTNSNLIVDDGLL